MDPLISCNKRPRGEANLDGPPRDWVVGDVYVPENTSYSYSPLSLEPSGQLPIFDYTYYTDAAVLQSGNTVQQRKKLRLSTVQIPTPCYSQAPVNRSIFPVGLCSFHQNILCYQDPWQGTDMTIMDLNASQLTKKMVEFGLSICPCCSADAQRSEGYLRLNEPQSMQSSSQPYIAEKVPLTPFTAPLNAMKTLSHDQISPNNKRLMQSISCDSQVPPDHYQSDESSASPSSGQDRTQTHGIGIEFGPWQPSDNYMPEQQRLNEPVYTNYYERAPPNATVALFPGAEGLEPPHSNGPPPVPLSSLTIVPAHGHSARLDSQWHPRQQGKRGPFRDAALREETAYTRKIGCCIRCRMQRIRCDKNPEDPDGICLTCKKIANVKAGRLPCLRLKIADVKLFKPGQVPGYEWTRRWANGDADPIHTWLSSEIKVITISEGYSDNPLSLRVRKFVPQEGDKLDRSWVYDGQKKSVQVPPYALIDLEEAKFAYEDYINKAIPTTIHKVIGPPKGLLYKTYKQTASLFRRSDLSNEARTLLQSALRLWMSARLTTISCFIVGEETLGMPQNILDETSPTPGKVPLPPVLGAQLDMVLIHDIQKKLRKDVLDQLQRIIQKNKHCNWLVIYIVTFVLLHNTSLIIGHDAGYARKHGMKRRFARENMVKEYHLGANILLAHFHYCNKGTYPLSDECTEADLKELAELNEDDLSFVHYTQRYARWKEAEWKVLRGSGAYDDTYFYICQLFEQDWQPRTMA